MHCVLLSDSYLTGGNLDPRFWPYAFYYFLFIKNMLPGKDDTSYFEHLHGGLKDDLTGLCTVGCVMSGSVLLANKYITQSSQE
jgi:hypothetical protein